jgi:hypothetical protein
MSETKTFTCPYPPIRFCPKANDCQECFSLKECGQLHPSRISYGASAKNAKCFRCRHTKAEFLAVVCTYKPKSSESEFRQ